jgi:hypothetical protein
MRKLMLVSLLLILTLPAAAATKDTGKTTLKDVQPATASDKKQKKLRYDLSLSTPSGKDYTCRSKSDSLKATDMVVGSEISYEIKGDKGKIKLSGGKNVDCTIVRVANSPVAAPPPADAPAATRPNQ